MGLELFSCGEANILNKLNIIPKLMTGIFVGAILVIYEEGFH